MAIKGRILCKNCKFYSKKFKVFTGNCSAFQDELSLIDSGLPKLVLVEPEGKCYKFKLKSNQ